MRFFTLMFVLLGSMFSLRAQVPVLSWQQGYGTAAHDEVGGVTVQVPGANGGYLIAGQELLPNDPVRARVYLARTNWQGDTLWTRHFVPALSLQPNPTGLAVDAQGNVVMTVSSVNAPAIPFSQLMKFNSTCDTILWQNFYQPVAQPGEVGASTLTNVVTAPDGNYIFLKTDFTGSNITFHNRGNLIKVSSATGGELWNFDVSQYAVGEGYSPDLFTLNAFEQYSGGSMLYLDLYNPTNQTGAEKYVFVSDAGLVTSSRGRVITSSAPDSNPVYHTLRDGNIVVGRRQKVYKISTAPATAGDTLWYTSLPRAYAYRDWDARDIVEDQDGNLLVVADSYLAQPNTTPYSRQIHLVRLSGRGVLNQDTMLYRPGETFGRSALLADNGVDLVFSGYATPGIFGGTDMLLARYRGFRRLLGTRGGAGGEVAGLQPYPNPAQGTTQVQLLAPGAGTLRVLDALGRQVQQQRVPVGAGVLTLPVAGLAAGVYVLRFEPAGGGAPRMGRLLLE